MHEMVRKLKEPIREAPAAGGLGPGGAGGAVKIARHLS